MSELRLVPAALLCWAATWIVLAHRGWALPLLLVAVTAGIGANASGGFYTSWRDLRASVRVNERAGK